VVDDHGARKFNYAVDKLQPCTEARRAAPSRIYIDIDIDIDVDVDTDTDIDI
jgi:hypothetical protein